MNITLFALVLVLTVQGEDVPVQIGKPLTEHDCIAILLENSKVAKLGQLVCVPLADKGDTSVRKIAPNYETGYINKETYDL